MPRGGRLGSLAGPRLRSRLRRLEQATTAARVTARGGWCSNDLGRRLYVNLGDRRGLELARKRGSLDPGLVQAWRRLVRREEPAVVVDVGTNYGEVALSADYSHASHIVLVEPNPLVLPFLHRTVDAWGDPRVRLEECAAGDTAGTLPIHLSPSWSGTTSLVRSVDDSFRTEVDVKRLADLLPSHDGTTLVKVDVEGAECAVLAGLRGHECGRAVALVEHEHLSGAQLRDLSTEWSMSAIDRFDGRLIPLDSGDVSGVPTESILRDLVLTRAGAAGARGDASSDT